MKQELNDRQMDLAIALREIVKTPDNASCWGHFNDFRRSMAKVLEGGEHLIRPLEMAKRFASAWQDYATLVSAESNRIILEILGQEEFDKMKSHPNGRKAFGRIMSRIEDVYGELTPGMTAHVEVEDIMTEELGVT